VTRRDFLALMGSAFAWPAAVRAQTSSRTRTIGYLGLEADPFAPGRPRPLPAAFSKLGWNEGENLVIERAYADLDAGRLAGLVAELIRKRVDVILTNGSDATLAAARATKTIPIVFFNVVWPVEQGLIQSFARPGGNLTGAAWYTGVEVTNKRLEFLREIAPAARRLSWIWPPTFTETVAGGRYDMVSAMQAAAKGLGFEPRFHDVRDMDGVDTALGEIVASRAQSLTVSGQHALAARQKIADFALRHRLPSAFAQPEYVEAGGLLSYAPLVAEQFAMFYRSISYVDRVLRGALPADLPVERPSRYELTINLKTAKALGLAIPQSVLLRADRVIE
jgi:putative ABC transport system substrate-binding protein